MEGLSRTLINAQEIQDRLIFFTDLVSKDCGAFERIHHDVNKRGNLSCKTPRITMYNFLTLINVTLPFHLVNGQVRYFRSLDRPGPRVVRPPTPFQRLHHDGIGGGVVRATRPPHHSHVTLQAPRQQLQPLLLWRVLVQPRQVLRHGPVGALRKRAKNNGKVWLMRTWLIIVKSSWTIIRDWVMSALVGPLVQKVRRASIWGSHAWYTQCMESHAWDEQEWKIHLDDVYRF